MTYEFYKGASLSLLFATAVPDPESGEERQMVTGFTPTIKIGGYLCDIVPIDEYSFRATLAPAKTAKLEEGSVAVVLYLEKNGKVAVGSAPGLTAVEPAQGSPAGTTNPVEIEMTVTELSVNFSLTLNNMLTYQDLTPAEIESLMAGVTASAQALEVNITNTVNGKIEEVDAAIAATNTATYNANAAADLAGQKAMGAQTAATNANNKAALANTAAGNADTKAALANNAATAANDAAVLANQRAGEALSATTAANTATGNANSATQAAKSATTQTLAAKSATEAATLAANNAADLANAKAGLADEKATAANDAATLANSKATLANEKATEANNAAIAANEKAGYANTQGSFAKEQGELAQTAREGIEGGLAAKIDKSSITSELGDSEELVMSQKGVEEKVKLPVESGEQAAAAALIELKKEVAYLKKVLNNVITYLQINTLSVDSLQIKGAPLFIFSDVVPAVVPDFAGQIYIKTTATAAAWIALGDSSVSNWKEV